jgi:2-keto-3-deoxy-L-rhamnonate aldolase RhmA
MTGAELRSALHAGDRVYGTCVVSPSPTWPAMIASTGLDFVFIDTEHIPLDRSQVSWMCQTYNALGLPPIVRIPSCDAALANMAIDGGARGIVSPYAESVAEIDVLRGAAKYRPLKGERLARVLSGEDELDEPTKSYIADMNANNLCLVNIESGAAIAKLDELVAVPDVDALLIGPHDLSISLDIPEDYGNPKFTDAIQKIIDAARGADLGVGFHFSFGIEHAQRWAEMGANLIIHSTDIFVVQQNLSADIATLRTALGDEQRNEPSGDSTVTV